MHLRINHLYIPCSIVRYFNSSSIILINPINPGSVLLPDLATIHKFPDLAIGASQVNSGAKFGNTHHVEALRCYRYPGITPIESVINPGKSAGHQLFFSEELNATAVSFGRGFRSFPCFAPVVTIKTIFKGRSIS